MAYVVARPRGRFEIRESVHTPKGSRARSLASFKELDDQVLAKARRRASRPFDAEAVRASADRAVAATASASPAPTPRHRRADMRRFVESSRRMARTLETRPARAGTRRDPGDALIALLDFVAQATATRPTRPAEPLRFPPLAALRAARRQGARG